jgi:TatD DNase family protein
VSASEFPPLDCHAHIAPDVTDGQVAALGGAIVFAMTRHPAEAAAASRRHDDTIVWGFGAHPGVRPALDALTPALVERALDQHVLVGEIGLDRRGALPAQQAALEMILSACQGRPALLSIHSAGRTSQVLDLLERHPHPGVILHWFNGSNDDLVRAVELGCYFSVNNAMDDARLEAMPRDRLLPETDFPATRRTIGAGKPGDLRTLERKLTRPNWAADELRRRWYANLGTLVERAGAMARLPTRLQDLIRAATER